MKQVTSLLMAALPIALGVVAAKYISAAIDKATSK